MDPGLLRRTAEIAAEYLTSLPERPVRADASLDELRSALRVVLEDGPQPPLQVLVRFACDGANVTGEVIDAVQREGTCWMSSTEWEGEPAMRISVCNWRTTEDDTRRSARDILAQVGIAAQASAYSTRTSAARRNSHVVLSRPGALTHASARSCIGTGRYAVAFTGIFGP